MFILYLQDVKAFETFDPTLLQQICYYGYYEDLEKGITRKFKFIYLYYETRVLFYIFLLR